ncbi:MAG: aminopeptidase P family protein [Ruminococcus sp.]|nr:aminopeptidase P family protein [Ruminococcus sp.]
MTELFQIRKKHIRDILKTPHTAALITNEVNIGYFCGFFHSEGYLLVTAENTYLLVDFRYIEAAKRQANDCEVICFQKLSEELMSLLVKNTVQSVHIEQNSLTVARFLFFRDKFREKQIEVISDDQLDIAIGKSRVIKDDSEIKKIQTAQEIAEKAYLEMLNDVKIGVSERILAARLQYLIKRYGAEDISFDLITITGKKTSMPHGVPADDVIREGDFFTCDFGAVYEGYHSDTTRTVAVGSATDEMCKIYDIVLQAQRKALTVVRAGVAASSVDEAARDVITQAGFGAYFGHATGHGVGLNIHEAPTVSSRSREILQSGMIITDEPGIYLPDCFGVRIEDMLLVTDTGYQNFVSLPKELNIL